jgi:hypothetical protein
MSNTNDSPPLSYADLVAAELFPHGYPLPALVIQLPTNLHDQLLADPLIPMLSDRSVQVAQREMLESFREESLNLSLCDYCKGLLGLSKAGWEFVAKQGLPDLKHAPTAVRAGDLSQEDRADMIYLYTHWIQLQRYAGTPSKAAAYSGLVSRLSVGS